MPTARRVLAAAGLFAAVVAVGTPALATPGSSGHADAVRPALVHPSANAAEHAHAHKPAKAHANRPVHRRHAARAATAVSIATASSGRTRTVHTATKTVSRASAAAATNPGKHLAKGAKHATQPAKSTPSAVKPAKSKPGKGTAGTATKPVAAKTDRAAATSQARAAFGETAPLALGRQVAAVAPVSHPAARATPKPRSNGGSTKTAAAPLIPTISPKKAMQAFGNALYRLTGISLFSGPLGWIFAGMLLIAVVMMLGAFALGRRPRSAR